VSVRPTVGAGIVVTNALGVRRHHSSTIHGDSIAKYIIGINNAGHRTKYGVIKQTSAVQTKGHEEQGERGNEAVFGGASIRTTLLSPHHSNTISAEANKPGPPPWLTVWAEWNYSHLLLIWSCLLWQLTWNLLLPGTQEGPHRGYLGHLCHLHLSPGLPGRLPPLPQPWAPCLPAPPPPQMHAPWTPAPTPPPRPSLADYCEIRTSLQHKG
jgi:hypothetical protein